MWECCDPIDTSGRVPRGFACGVARGALFCGGATHDAICQPKAKWVLTTPPPNPTQSSEWLLEPLRHAPSLTDVHGEHCPVGFVLGVGGIDVGLELVAGVCRWTV